MRDTKSVQENCPRYQQLCCLQWLIPEPKTSALLLNFMKFLQYPVVAKHFFICLAHITGFMKLIPGIKEVRFLFAGTKAYSTIQ